MVYITQRPHAPPRQPVPQRPQPSRPSARGVSIPRFRGLRSTRSCNRRRDPLAPPGILARLLRVDEDHRCARRFSGQPRRCSATEAKALLMSVRYLLDTNTASFVIKGNVPRVRERLLKVPMAEIGISAVTEAELRFGVARKPEAVSLKIAVQEFLLCVEILP